MDTASIPSLGNVVAQKYRIDREIGRGGMGIVYAATDLTLGRAVALKLMISADPRGGTGRPATATSEQDTARFMREARATAALRGEHVAQVYEAGVTPDGLPFLAMELLHGEDLDHYVIRRGPLPYAEACDLMVQACAALAEAHQLGIVHRDLKPQNFFVLPPRDATGPKLKVLDFGISKMTSEADLALTQTSMTMGSPRYMSPEQVRSSKYVDARADIWALGAVLFEAVAGRPLFNESTASALHAQIIADAATPLRNVRLDAPAELEQVVLRCVEKDPARRFASTIELAQALAPFATLHGRDIASRLLAAHGVPMPVSITSQAVPYAAGTPGYTSTGQPLSHPATGAQRAAAKSTSYVWVWVVLGLFALLCVVGAAISALVLRAAAQTVSQLPSGVPSDVAPPDDDLDTDTDDLDTDTDETSDAAPLDPRTPRAFDASRPRADTESAKQARQIAEQKERDRAFADDSRAFAIRSQTEQMGAQKSCTMNELLVHNPNFDPHGAAVGATLDACREAHDDMAVSRIKNGQSERDRKARASKL